MRVLITGGSGFLGTRLARALLQRGGLVSKFGEDQPISNLVLVDIKPPPADLAAHPKVTVVNRDACDPDALEAACSPDTASVFHLAALVSGGAEKDFSAGMDVNFVGMWRLLERCRENGNNPRFVFTSSIAVYGGDLPEVIDDRHHLTPQSSYGAQKAIGEQLVSDYSRKGYIDGRSVRLPIIAVRSGKANTAASSWASAIVREPLAGETYACPVKPDDIAFILSHRKVIEGLILAHDSPTGAWGVDRSVMMPGLSCRAKDIVAALENVAGKKIADLITWHPDPVIRGIVNTWPARFTLEKAMSIGFTADEDIEKIISNYIADELDGTAGAAVPKH